MVDIKQIQYFVACAQTGSFSEAAERLYTTQPNVSKVIKSMELENLEKLQKFDTEKQKETLMISSNTSSWFADTFVEYYQLHEGEQLHYQICSTGTHEIVKRVQERSDDLGFVYVVKDQMAPFQYFLSRNYLEFVPLRFTDIMLYPGERHPYWKDRSCILDFSEMKLVQSFPDEFSMDNYWNIQDENGRSAADAETVVVTNSDYIMERILKISDLVNISGNYLTGEHSQVLDGVRLSETEEQKMVFGYVKRRGEELAAVAEDFIDFLEEKLNH